MSRDEVLREIVPEEWSVEMGQLVCPCGYIIELDGECPEGHKSPVREKGMI